MQLSKKSLDIIKKGSSIAGGVTGTALSLLTKEPIALLAASGIGAHLPNIINDFAERFLSQREQIKVGALEAFTIYKIQQNLELDKSVNQKFIEEDQHQLSIFDLYEGTLIKAKNEFEEKKIELISSVFANSIFTNDLNPHDANHILNLVATLSYRKLCIIAFYHRRQEFSQISLLPKPFLWYEDASFSLGTMITSQDIFELREQGILDAGSGNNLMAPDKTHLTPNEMQISPIGELYTRIIDFKDIDQEDIVQIVTELEYRPEYGHSKY